MADFLTFHQLERHVLTGKHKLRLQRQTLHDFCVEKAASSLSADLTSRAGLITREITSAVLTEESELEKGWALSEKKKRNSNDLPARQFVTDYFWDRRKKDQRADPNEAETLMKAAKTREGKVRFSPKNRLSLSQIKSLINGLLKKERDGIVSPTSIEGSDSEVGSSDDEEALNNVLSKASNLFENDLEGDTPRKVRRTK